MPARPDFQLWDSTQALCSYVRGMLTSQAILAGIGVGEQVCAPCCKPKFSCTVVQPARFPDHNCPQAATPLAAVFNFFVRDFTAMLGGVLFAFCQVRAEDAFVL